MFSRVAVSITAVWAILLLPALCAGGVLLHECSACTSAEACEHEAGCTDDPCSPVLKQRDDGAHTPADLAPAALTSTDEMDDEWLSAARRTRPAHWRALAPRPVRHADSGLPLLN